MRIVTLVLLAICILVDILLSLLVPNDNFSDLMLWIIIVLVVVDVICSVLYRKRYIRSDFFSDGLIIGEKSRRRKLTDKTSHQEQGDINRMNKPPK